MSTAKRILEKFVRVLELCCSHTDGRTDRQTHGRLIFIINRKHEKMMERSTCGSVEEVEKLVTFKIRGEEFCILKKIPCENHDVRHWKHVLREFHAKWFINTKVEKIEAPSSGAWPFPIIAILEIITDNVRAKFEKDRNKKIRNMWNFVNSGTCVGPEHDLVTKSWSTTSITYTLQVAWHFVHKCRS